jgi:hypothetical protein
MSALAGHAKAMRALAEAFAFEGNECGDDRNALLLCRVSAAFSRAALSLGETARAECSNEENPPLHPRRQAVPPPRPAGEPTPERPTR